MSARDFPTTILAALLATAGLALVVSACRGANEDPSAAGAMDAKAVAAEIWALEQVYWECNRDADQEGIISAWHDRFLGWPEGEPRPIDKREGVRFVRENYAQPAQYSFEIEPAGIRILGNTAVNYYTLHRTWKDDAAKKQSMRIVHTWIREAAGWKVLGGMSDGD